jgi:hypothetical protein
VSHKGTVAVNAPSSAPPSSVVLFREHQKPYDAKRPHARVPALPGMPDNAAAARAEGLLAALRERRRALRAYVDAELDVIIAELATARPRRRRGGPGRHYTRI